MGAQGCAEQYRADALLLLLSNAIFCSHRQHVGALDLAPLVLAFKEHSLLKRMLLSADLGVGECHGQQDLVQEAI